MKSIYIDFEVYVKELISGNVIFYMNLKMYLIVLHLKAKTKGEAAMQNLSLHLPPLPLLPVFVESECIVIIHL